jgi:UDP-N-acetylmuramoyl-L-alanyl-D-glutamate--2,6-diaminopimelate ligase
LRRIEASPAGADARAEQPARLFFAPMKLREVLAGAAVIEYSGDPEVEVSELAYDNRQAAPGTLYFCVPGSQADGHDFAPAAVAAGASALVVERPLELAVPQARVARARDAMGPAAARFFGDPTRELALAGITGTNGKTTTAFLVRHLLEAAGTRTGLLGTVKRTVGGVDEEVVRTTPEAIDLQRTFRRMVDAGDRACAMEVSSHALAQGRIAELDFDVAAFTNLTQDHLDFHRDMEDYFLAKRRLFGVDGDAVARPRRCVVNVDDPYGARLAADLRAERPESVVRVSPTGLEEAELAALDVSFDAAGSRFRIVAADEGVAAAIPLPGHFNVANALVAVTIVSCLGVAIADAAAALAISPPVPGRLEPVGGDAPFTVLVDYAHTPDSLRGVLEAARRLAAGRLIVVFGAGGDRDRAKRPLMGAIAAQLADVAVVTSDNPRSEEPGAIIEAILSGINTEGDARVEVMVEPDRRAAIARALTGAAPGDVVVIAGKGHEQGQEFAGGRKVPFDDRQVAREELARLRASGELVA